MPAWAAMEQGILRHVLKWHRRSGKDDWSLHRGCVAAFERVAPYWHMLPLATQARKAIWNAVNPHSGKRRIDEAFPAELRENVNEQEMFIRFKNGSTWQVLGSDNYNTHVGSPPAGIVFSEYALADPNAWAYLRPIVAENGGWASFISTTRGHNHFTDLYDFAVRDPSWFAQTLTVEDTNVFTREQIEQERRELAAERGEQEANAIIRQEYYCDADASIPGAYYGEHMSTAQAQGRIGTFPWIPHLPVGTAWDLGHNDTTVIWFYQQPPGGRIRLIDVVEGSNVGIDWYARRCARLPYSFVDHIWPHDGGHGDIRDVAGQTLEKTANSLGLRPVRVLDRDLSIDTGINAVRQMLGLCEFNDEPMPHVLEGGVLETPAEARVRMRRALNALRQYRRVWNEKNRRYNDTPLHDWTSNTADSLRYLARGRKPFPGGRVGVRRQTVADLDYQTLG